jgi:hypothetical protein
MEGPAVTDGRSAGFVVRRPCAHTDKTGQGPRWLEPGETCDRPRARDLLESAGLEPARLCFDEPAQ